MSSYLENLISGRRHYAMNVSVNHDNIGNVNIRDVNIRNYFVNFAIQIQYLSEYETVNENYLKNKPINYCDISNKFMETCNICLEDYNKDDKVKELPKCKHYFHVDCIDSWVNTKKHNCPVCRCDI